ncbi:hypothetical protein [Bacteroides intestinalis]|jgi:hypothetical protein|uniref:hypothetical protein n=1 Tax=Bacteroides intestinalis TaxID=329854 RepID=UPI0022E40651|nr:hypothetical protein [Bacteroides intestinalis]
MKLLKLQDAIPFGKLRGKVISDIWVENPAYFKYLVKKNEKFLLDRDVFDELRKLYPNDINKINILSSLNIRKTAKIYAYRIEVERAEYYNETIDYEEQEREDARRSRYYELGGFDFDLWQSGELDDIDYLY